MKKKQKAKAILRYLYDAHYKEREIKTEMLEDGGTLTSSSTEPQHCLSIVHKESLQSHDLDLILNELAEARLIEYTHLHLNETYFKITNKGIDTIETTW